jgi:hypothetical protein
MKRHNEGLQVDEGVCNCPFCEEGRKTHKIARTIAYWACIIAAGVVVQSLFGW